MQLAGIIFDLDGTLGNTIPICLEALRVAIVRTTGMDYDHTKLEALFGPTEQGILRQIIGNGWEDAAEILYSEYDALHSNQCQEPFDGISEALGMLQSMNVKMGLVTGKGSRTAAISLRHMGLEGIFDPIETGSDLGPVKPELMSKVVTAWQLDPSTIAYLGDAPSDVDAARSVGIIPLSAAWADTASADDIRERNPEKLFCEVDEFIEWIRSLR